MVTSNTLEEAARHSALCRPHLRSQAYLKMFDQRRPSRCAAAPSAAARLRCRRPSSPGSSASGEGPAGGSGLRQEPAGGRGGGHTVVGGVRRAALGRVGWGGVGRRAQGVCTHARVPARMRACLRVCACASRTGAAGVGRAGGRGSSRLPGHALALAHPGGRCSSPPLLSNALIECRTTSAYKTLARPSTPPSAQAPRSPPWASRRRHTHPINTHAHAPHRCTHGFPMPPPANLPGPLHPLPLAPARAQTPTPTHP